MLDKLSLQSLSDARISSASSRGSGSKLNEHEP
jgi:hypothetical protein